MKQNPIRIELQNECDSCDIPDIAQLQAWVRVSLQKDYSNLEQTIRIVKEDESRQLNQNYRNIDKPTNVLSFPAHDIDAQARYLDYDYLGDLVICAAVVEKQALDQGKSRLSHWAHMVIHGMLHLQGFDHSDATDAEAMEALEIEILASLGHTNPYQT